MTERKWWEHDPYAEVRKVGPKRFVVRICHDMTVYGPGGYGWYIWGERRAYRKAERELARYVERQARQENVLKVTPDGMWFL